MPANIDKAQSSKFGYQFDNGAALLADAGAPWSVLAGQTIPRGSVYINTTTNELYVHKTTADGGTQGNWAQVVNSDGTVNLDLVDLGDVDPTGLGVDDLLIYNGTSWVVTPKTTFVETAGGSTISGALDINGHLDVDNLRLDGNVLSAQNTNGSINLTPNGTGEAQVAGQRILTESDLANLNDADTLDGLDSTQFLRSDQNDTMTGQLTIDTGSQEALRVDGGASPFIGLYENGTRYAYIQAHATSGLIINSSRHGVPLYVTGEDAGGTAQNLFYADPDSNAFLYHNGNWTLKTISTGVEARGNASQSQVTLKTSDDVVRGYLFADNSNNVGFVDSGGSWAVKHTNDQGTTFYSDNEGAQFAIGTDLVTGSYGTVETKGSGKNTWEGYNINGRAVFMHDGASRTGLFDDVNNLWIIYGDHLGSTVLHHSGAVKLETLSTGARVTGDLTVTGGDITLDGTGRIQGIDTVSAGTDAANKTYVDNAVAGNTDADTLDGLDSTQFLRSDADDTTTGSLTLGTSGKTLSFGSRTQELVQLYATDYTIGMQASTAYVRTAERFSVHKGGTHSTSENDPGAGGSTLFTVKGTGSVIEAFGNTVWHAGNDGGGSGLDADMVDGYHAAEASTVSTVAVRNSSGDINARLFRSEYDTTNATVGYIMTQIDTVSNNYIRPTTPAQFRSAVTDGVYLPVAGQAADSDTVDGFHATAYNVFTGNACVTRHSSGYIWSNYFNMSANDVGATTPTRVAVETNNDDYLRWDTWASFTGKVETALDGSVDAGTLDGLNSTQFLRSDTNDTMTGQLIIDTTAVEALRVDGGTNPYISLYQAGTRYAYIQANSTGLIIAHERHGVPVRLQAEDTSGTVRTLVDADPDGSADLYHNGSLKLATSGDGIAVSGKVTANSYAENALIDTTNTGTVDIDCAAAGVQERTLTGNVTFTFSGTVSGDACTITLILKQDATGGRTVTWPASVDWPGGTAPTVSSAANAVDIYTFITTDNGTTWYGMASGQDFS